MRAGPWACFGGHELARCAGDLEPRFFGVEERAARFLSGSRASGEDRSKRTPEVEGSRLSPGPAGIDVGESGSPGGAAAGCGELFGTDAIAEKGKG